MALVLVALVTLCDHGIEAHLWDSVAVLWEVGDQPRRLFSSAQSGLTTSISIITAATKPLSDSAVSAHSFISHTLSPLHFCCFGPFEA